MKKILLSILILLALLSCAIDIPDDDDPGYPPFNGGDTLDIVTWNLQLFPKNGSASIDYLEAAVRRMKPDVIAFQEVSSESALSQLAGRLPDYSYAYGTGGDDWRLAYLYNHTALTPDTAVYEIYPASSRPFPRPPLVFELTWNGERTVIIDNHFKASGNGV
ncbi:MAG: endonuclease/exonuclease/phosphatase family protein, partial [Candidatus Marinimicrobia bacterium]|nr:endonuclease/exonuclease/phosphatase family protein [Candidatus Neomarinimicrobiota bacterium]